MSRAAIASWLDEFFGHVQIESACSGADALRAVEKNAPDLMLTAHPMTAKADAKRLAEWLAREHKADPIHK